jgi:ABC-type proline/glycine betaine transport system permease subunit
MGDLQAGGQPSNEMLARVVLASLLAALVGVVVVTLYGRLREFREIAMTHTATFLGVPAAAILAILVTVATAALGPTLDLRTLVTLGCVVFALTVGAIKLLW